MKKHASDDPVVLTPTDARGGKPVKGMPSVLIVSTLGTVFALVFYSLYFLDDGLII